MMMIITIIIIIIIICIKISQTRHEHKVTKLWNQVPAQRNTPNNKPDIIRVIRDNKQGTCVIIGAAIPGDRNVIKKEAEKVLKYKDLITEIKRIWNVKAKVIPVITGASGTISNHSDSEQHTGKARH